MTLKKNSDSEVNPIEFERHLSELSENDFMIRPSTYSVRFGAKGTYQSDTLELDLLAEIDTTGHGKIVQLIFYYRSDSFRIKHLQYPVFKLKDLVHFREKPPIYFQDYNFDNFPDVAIRNRESSGVKNQVYNIYLYHPARHKYLKDRFLSGVTNPTLNDETQTLTTFSQGGMASRIYSKGFYQWNHEKFVLIKHESQTYSDTLSSFLRTTRKLVDSAWVTQVDTLIEEELSW